MGDPATPLWTAAPRALAVTAPAAVDAAADALPVGVATGGAPVAGAVVAVRAANGDRGRGHDRQRRQRGAAAGGDLTAWHRCSSR